MRKRFENGKARVFRLFRKARRAFSKRADFENADWQMVAEIGLSLDQIERSLPSSGIARKSTSTAAQLNVGQLVLPRRVFSVRELTADCFQPFLVDVATEDLTD